MLLPCPECQTVYNAEPSVYKPGMAFQCVSCGAVVVVPDEEAQAELEAPDEPAPDSSLTGEPVGADKQEGEPFDFDLELPSSLDVEEPQPTMVFDPSSLEQAVSDAFSTPESQSSSSGDISDDFFDKPGDGVGESMPAPFSPSLDIDGQATRQLDAGGVTSTPLDSAELPAMGVADELDQPTMVLSSRHTDTDDEQQDAAVAAGLETRVLESAASQNALDAVDLLDDLFDDSAANSSGLSLPKADAIEPPQDNDDAGGGGFDLTDDIFGGSGEQQIAPSTSADEGASESDQSGLDALDFDDLVNQPLGSDDVSFSFDDLSSVGQSSASGPQTPEPASPNQQAPTQVLSDQDRPVDQVEGAAEQAAASPKTSHTWVGLGLVVVALALIASTADIASLLDGKLGDSSTSSASDPSADAKTAKLQKDAPAAAQVEAPSTQTESIDAVFSQDYGGLVRMSETSTTAPALKALAQYRLSRYFGEAKRLANASSWRKSFEATDSTTKTETIVALAIGSVLPDFSKAANDSAELLLAKKESLEPFEQALVAHALSGSKQRATSVSLFKDVLTKSPSSVEIWELFLAQHTDRESKSWAVQTLRALNEELNDWQQARFVDLFLKIGRPELVVNLLLKSRPAQQGASSTLAKNDQFSLLRLNGLRGIFQGDLKPWQSFANLRQQARPNLENFIAQSRVNSLIDGKISAALIERARTEKAPVIQARLYYETAILGRDLALEKETSALVKEMVKSLSPTKTGGYFQLARGELAMLMGNRALARRFINASLKINPRLTDASLASLMLIDRDKDVFLRELTKLHQRGDSSRVAWQLARVFSERNNHGGALRLLEELLVATPTVAPVSTLLLSLLDNFVANGDYEKLAQLSESLYQANPKDSELVTLMVDALSPSAEFPDRLKTRVKWTERLHKLDPANRDNLYLWVEAMLDAEKQTEARDVLKALLDEYPDARGTARFTQLTARSWIAENPSVARQFLKESVRHERMASTHVLLGELEEKRQSQIDAIEQYLLAIELEPSLTEIRFRVGRLLYEVGRYPEASAQLEVVVNSNPANAVARELLGDTFREQGKFEQSLRQYRRVLDQGNVREALLMKTARLQMYELNRLEDAVRSLQQAALLNDKNSEILYLLGVALKDLNQLERARRQFQKYLRLDSTGDYAEEVRGILKNL